MNAFNNLLEILWKKGAREFQLIHDKNWYVSIGPPINKKCFFLFTTKTDIKNSIIIHSLSTKDLKKLDSVTNDIYNINTLTYNIFEHELVPEARLVTPEERKDIEKYYGSNIKLYPKIKQTDVIIKTLGFKINDMVCFEREIGPYYRIVVE